MIGIAPLTSRIVDPVHHFAMAFQHEDDERLWVHSWLDPGGHLPEHFHPTLQERWEALDGSIRLKIDGAWRRLTPQDGIVTVAPSVRHELLNDGDRTVHLRAAVSPPGRLEEFLIESARAAREGLYTGRNLPTGLRGAAWMSAFALRFADETVMCSPPPALQRLVLPVAARLTRRYLQDEIRRR